MNNGWIKIYRSLKEHAVFSDESALRVFLWILLSADSHTGIYSTGRVFLAELLHINPNTLYSILKRLEMKFNLIKKTINSKGTEISVLNWANYQSPTKSSTANQQPVNTSSTLYKNTRIQEKKLTTSVVSKESEGEQKLFKTPEYLLNIPLEDFVSLKKGLTVTDQQVKFKAEGLYNWYLADPKKRARKDWKAVLRGALIKDFPAKESDGYISYKEAKERGLAW